MGSQYCACCIDDEEIYFYSLGATPDEAFNEFVNSGMLEGQCNDWLVKTGDEIEVYIYSICDPDLSDWPEDEASPDWAFVLDKKIETRTAKAI